MSTILVVDDDPNIRELVRVFLQEAGFEVAEAADGVQALAKLEALKADLVILFSRLISLPDDQLQHIYKYLDSGKPIIGMRTATHG